MSRCPRCAGERWDLSSLVGRRGAAGEEKERGREERGEEEAKAESPGLRRPRASPLDKLGGNCPLVSVLFKTCDSSGPWDVGCSL